MIAKKKRKKKDWLNVIKCDCCAHSTTPQPKRNASCNHLCPAATYLVVCLQVVQRELQHLLLLGRHVKILQSLLENKTSTSAFVLTRAAGETQSNFELFYSSVVLLFTAFCASHFGNLYRSERCLWAGPAPCRTGAQQLLPNLHRAKKLGKQVCF